MVQKQKRILRKNGWIFGSIRNVDAQENYEDIVNAKDKKRRIGVSQNAYVCIWYDENKNYTEGI